MIQFDLLKFVSTGLGGATKSLLLIEGEYKMLLFFVISVASQLTDPQRGE